MSSRRRTRRLQRDDSDSESEEHDDFNRVDRPEDGVRDDFDDADADDADRLSASEIEAEEEGEDLLDENMLADYKPIPELDRYEDEGVDEEDVEPMSHAERLAAEREMRRRDMEEARLAGRMPSALQYGIAGFGADDEEAELEEADRRRRRRFVAEGEDGELMEGADGADAMPMAANLSEYIGPPREYLALPSTCNTVKVTFRNFLTSFRVGQSVVYIDAINRMCAENGQSLEVSYLHLTKHSPVLAVWATDEPEIMLRLFSEVVTEMVKVLFPGYERIHPVIIARITHLPVIDSIRDLRQVHLNGLVRVTGVAVRRTSVFPQLQIVKYNCAHCNELIGPFFQTGSQAETKPSRCPACQRSGPFTVNMRETLFQNYQKITLQESPGTVPAGRVPRQKEIIVLHDLIDSCAPGEEIEVTGIYRHSYDQGLNRQSGFPVFQTSVLANHIAKRDEANNTFTPTDDDLRDIIRLSKQPNVARMLINSIAPSIYGHDHIKTCITMALFGGVAKEFESKHRIRGDINVLMLGDPGTAKSQFLKYVEKTAQRAVYTTGKGASAVGLTASVHQDPVTREWTLEGGALVLADQGICLIDEFDKMSDQDRTSIHEAMEQQSISVSKAGIVCTLKARCGVIAAANPISGRYVNTLSFQEQVDLTEPILSRFDCLCVVRDVVDRATDEKLASFVIDSHISAHPEAEDNGQQGDVLETAECKSQQRKALEQKDQIPQDLLRKYIAYARQYCHPKLTAIDGEKIVKLYSDLRKEAEASGGIKITSRHVESLIRMAEAHAKMHLRDHVNDEDLNVAIKTMLESFISTQKLSVRNAMERQFQKYISHGRDKFELLLDVLMDERRSGLLLRQLTLGVDTRTARSTQLEIRGEAFQQRAAALGVSDVSSFYKSKLFSENGFVYDSTRRVIVCHFDETG